MQVPGARSRFLPPGVVDKGFNAASLCQMPVYALFTGIPNGMKEPKETKLRLFPSTTADDVHRFLLSEYSMPPGTCVMLKEPREPHAAIPVSSLHDYFDEEGDNGGPVEVTFTTPLPQRPGGPGARPVQSDAHPPATAPPSYAGTVPPDTMGDTSNCSTRKLPYSDAIRFAVAPYLKVGALSRRRAVPRVMWHPLRPY